MKKQTIESWKNALSKFVQKRYHDYDISLNSINKAEINGNTITIDCANVRYEASIEVLAKLNGCHPVDLKEEYEIIQSFELIEQLGLSLFHQESVNCFFDKLYDVYVTKSNLLICDIEISDWVLELKNKYTIVWAEVSNMPVPPFPEDLDNYELSYMTSS